MDVDDKWREYFRGSNSDIFSIIEHAIMVAASDYPSDFKLKRDRIAEMLFNCKTNKSDDGVRKSGSDDGGSNVTNESKANIGGGDKDDTMMNVNYISDDDNSFDEEEKFVEDLIEDPHRYYEEVLRIKDIIDRSNQESDEVLYHSLRRLQMMCLTIEIMMTTGIGKSVNGLRKHRSHDVGNLARTLVRDWKYIASVWIACKEGTSEVTTECEKSSTEEQEEEEGLPCPPLDDGAFFATPTSVDLTKFFDGIDDNDDLQNGGEFNKNQENDRKQRIEEESVSKKEVRPINSNGAHNDTSGLGRPKMTLPTTAQQKTDRSEMQKKTVPHRQQEKLNVTNGDTRLEATKRKMQERYKEVENAKKRRTIQVVELSDLPKQNLPQKKQQTKTQNRLRTYRKQFR